MKTLNQFVLSDIAVEAADQFAEAFPHSSYPGDEEPGIGSMQRNLYDRQGIR